MSKMSPDNGQQVRDLFDAALVRPVEERAKFLDLACVGDEALRREVESLLAADREAESFMETPAVAAAAQSLLGVKTRLAVGQQISHYKIMRWMGEGGMGEVYLAQNISLGSNVALKLLPDQFAADADRLRRFKQEARSASALNHPNILTVHEMGQDQGKHFIATEFIDGVTLRQKCAAGPLKLLEALDVACQVALALTAAHEAKIIHRDIKPENIMLRRDHIVKVLDFGLAKLVETTPAVDDEGPTKALVKTAPGRFIGTVSYSSPEQVQAVVLDARTDIWSLGVVLYEMVAGRPPFPGNTANHICVAILEREPTPLPSLAPDAPLELQRIVRKALAKDRDERYQTARDLLIDLKSLKQDLEFAARLRHSAQPELSGGEKHAIQAATETAMQSNAVHSTDPRDAPGLTTPLSPVEGNRSKDSGSPPNDGNVISGVARHVRLSVRRLILIASLPVLVIASGVLLYRLLHTSVPPLPPMKVVPFTSFQGEEYMASFSPDGNQIAFGWNGESGATRGPSSIYLKQMGTEKPYRITFPDTGFWDFGPVWSPDGQRLAFFRFTPTECAIFTVPALGGPQRRLHTLGPNRGWDMFPTLAWSPDGRFIACSYKDSKEEPYRIFLVSPDTFERQHLTSPSAENVGDFGPAFSPDGQSVAFFRISSMSSGFIYSADIYIVPISGGEPRRLTFDNTSLRGLDWTTDGREIVFSSNRGGVISSGDGFSLWRMPASGGEAERIALGGDSFWLPRISRHGNRLTYAEPSVGDGNIYRIGLSETSGSKNPPTRLIASTRYDGGPQFSPDGRRITFHSDRSGQLEIWMCDSDGTNLIPMTSSGPNKRAGTPRWSPDGHQIAFDLFEEGKGDVYAINVEGGPARPIATGDSTDQVPSWSRDGKWIYFASDRSGDLQVWKATAQGGAVVQVTKQGGFYPFESFDRKYVYYIKPFPAQGIWQVPVDGGEELQILDRFQSAKNGDWAVANDGIYFIEETKDGVAIQFFYFATRKVRHIAGLGPIKISEDSIAVSPDRRQILYTQMDGVSSDITLVENFR